MTKCNNISKASLLSLRELKGKRMRYQEKEDAGHNYMFTCAGKTWSYKTKSYNKISCSFHQFYPKYNTLHSRQQEKLVGYSYWDCINLFCYR
ncbi:hypothetical protein FKM82_022607 [Ascaphus truei]